MAFDWALPYPANRQPVFAQNMVATSQPLATAAGLAASNPAGMPWTQPLQRQSP